MEDSHDPVYWSRRFHERDGNLDPTGWQEDLARQVRVRPTTARGSDPQTRATYQAGALLVEVDEMDVLRRRDVVPGLQVGLHREHAVGGRGGLLGSKPDNDRMGFGTDPDRNRIQGDLGVVGGPLIWRALHRRCFTGVA
jgi:hypothetical protein